jgi:hypothetical protein
LRISHRGDSGIVVRSPSPSSAGTAPRPRISRQSTVPALPGATRKMTSAMRYATRMPTVIIHCCSMLSEPRRLLGAYSAMYAVAIAESAPMARPMSVRDASRIAASGAIAEPIAPIA